MADCFVSLSNGKPELDKGITETAETIVFALAASRRDGVSECCSRRLNASRPLPQLG